MNALGEPTPGGQLTSTPPEPGRQPEADDQPGGADGGRNGAGRTRAAGRLRLDEHPHRRNPRHGRRCPTYDPTVWTKTLSNKEAEFLFESEAKPIFNRATESAYPTGSTYKIITALAALENGVITGNTVINDNGYIELGRQKFENSEGAVNGPISLVHALEVSSDVFFYELGGKMNGTNRAAAVVERTGDRPTRPGSTCRSAKSATGAEQEMARRTVRGRMKPIGPGRSATTSSWRSARATCRPTRWRWRSPTRRSATAARSSPRTWAWKCRTRPGGC